MKIKKIMESYKLKEKNYVKKNCKKELSENELGKVVDGINKKPYYEVRVEAKFAGTHAKPAEVADGVMIDKLRDIVIPDDAKGDIMEGR